MGCTFLLEDKVVDRFKEIAPYGGWIIQQFIKFNTDKIGSADDILVIDADTVLLRPHVFIDDNYDRYTLHLHRDYCPHRKAFTRSLLKTNSYFKLDFVAHHMVFKRKWLKQLKEHLARLHGKPWDQAILDGVKTDRASFSEYDIYATYVALNYPKCVRLLASANVAIYRDRFAFFKAYRGVFSQDFKSLSSHSFWKFPA